MISVKNNRVSLSNLNETFRAIEQLTALIKHFSEDLPSPAYLTVNYCGSVDSLTTKPEIQLHRRFFVTALKEQRKRLEKYLDEIGIDWDVDDEFVE